MSTVNERIDYGSIVDSSGSLDVPNNGNPVDKTSRVRENKKKRTQEQKKTGVSKNRTKEHVSLEIKKSRVVVDDTGRKHRPYNITIADDNWVKIQTRAATLHVKPWKVLDEALTEYFVNHN